MNTMYLVLTSFMFLSSCKYFREDTKLKEKTELTKEDRLEFKMEVEKFHKYHNRLYDIDSLEIYNRPIYIKQKRKDDYYLEFKNYNKKTIEVTIYGAKGYDVFFLNFEKKDKVLIVNKII